MNQQLSTMSNLEKVKQGENLVKKKNYVAAKRVFQDLINNNNTNPQYYNELAKDCELDEKYKEADVLYNKAM